MEKFRHIVDGDSRENKSEMNKRAALEERRREIGRRTAGMGGRALAGGDPRENRGSAGAAESAGIESGAGGADQKRFGGVEGED